MFESIFKAELVALSSTISLSDRLWEEIQTNYSQSNRYYHNLEHLNFMVVQLLPAKDQVADWQILIFSVAYHDIIYDPSRPDNEEKSADLAVDRLSKLSLSQDKQDKCHRQILSTKHHQPGNDHDTNFLIDADLSILGAEEHVYFTYAGQIRNEYSHVPDHLYKAGRRKVLEHFLKMENIYKTKYFWGRYEDRARNNIGVELKSLS